MYSTGHFIQDKRPFSEKYWGHRTKIYVKLAKQLLPAQWKAIYGGLDYSAGYQESLREFSRPVEHWTDDPEEYFIVGSDPVDPAGEM